MMPSGAERDRQKHATIASRAVTRAIGLGLALVLTGLVGCGGPQTVVSQATDLLEMARARAHASDYIAALQQHREALRTLGRLSKEYPDSLEAAALRRGELTVLGVPVARLRTRELARATLRVRALTDPAATAVFLASRCAPQKTRDHALGTVAATLISAAPADARRAAKALGDGPEKVAALIATGGLEEAVQAARAIDAIRDRWPAVHEVATALANAGQFKRGVDLARSIPAPEHRAGALADLGLALAADGRGQDATVVLEEARTALALCPAGGAHARLLVTLGGIYARGGAREGMSVLLGRAAEMAKALPYSEQEAVLTAVARGYGEAGEVDRVLETLGHLTHPERRAEALETLLTAWADAKGQSPDAVSALMSAYAETQKLEPSEARAHARAELALALARQGAFVEAEKVGVNVRAPGERARALLGVAAVGKTAAQVALAKAAADQLFRAEARIGALMAVAALMGRLGQLEAGGEVLKAAWALVTDAATPMTQTSRLMALAEAALAEGQSSVAGSALQAIPRQAGRITERLTRASELSHLVALLTASGRMEAAGAALGPAIEAASGLEFEGSQARILLGLARQTVTIGVPAVPATKTLFEVARRLTDPDRRSAIMLALARAFATQRDFGRALEAAKAIENPVRRGDAMVAMADGAAQAQRSDRALEIAAAIPNRDRQAMACARIAARGGAIGPAGRAALTQMAKEAAP